MIKKSSLRPVLRLTKIDVFRALDSFRGKFERPGKNQRHGKSDDEQQHHKTHGPNSEFRRTEKSDSRSASVATPPLHRRSHPCKRCAASVQRRSFRVHSARLDEALVTWSTLL